VQAPVHLATRIGKNAQLEDFGRSLSRHGVRVPSLGADNYSLAIDLLPTVCPPTPTPCAAHALKKAFMRHA
jgi:hypothetical protein